MCIIYSNVRLSYMVTIVTIAHMTTVQLNSMCQFCDVVRILFLMVHFLDKWGKSLEQSKF